ncbi:hypothetical protein KAR26_03515 [Candidatus Parcubacteria bacterium]|nr:hypothetical protein [Candidatus Parcubacteria bacterium]
MFFRASKLIFLFVVLPALILPAFFLFAQEDLENTCALDNIEKQENILSREDYQKLLEKCQDYYEEESIRIEKDLTKTSQEKKTLQNQIYTLGNKIKNLDYQIYQSSLMIEDLSLQIEDTEVSIDKTSLGIEDSKEKLGNILRTIHKEDQKSIVEVFFEEDKLSDFFNDLVALEALNIESKELLENVKDLKYYLENQKVSLDGEKIGLEKTVSINSIQKKENANVKKEHEGLLKMTEAEYQKSLVEKEEAEIAAAEIAARIFKLVGVPDAPTFGEAISIAKLVTDRVEIRPAFLLAIISQESALGRNVGQCYITDAERGGGIYKSGKPVDRIIHYIRDLPPFLEITEKLGMDFTKTPVSCWIPNCINNSSFCGASVDNSGNINCYKSGYVPFGFGGAMGPAQFIPSTWVLFEDRVKSYTGSDIPNPWNIKDAFTASALYLYDLGASAQTRTSEANAASRYYGGSSSYARQVANRADCIQAFIDKGTMSSYCNGLIF